MRLFYWLGWIIVVAAWTDWCLMTFLGYDVWLQVFGIEFPTLAGIWTPVAVGSFGIVLIATCR